MRKQQREPGFGGGTAVLVAIALMTALFLLPPAAASGQYNMPEAAPAPPAMLRGDTIIVESLNFRANAPGPGWRWFVQEGDPWKTFHTLNEETGSLYSIIVGAGFRSPLNTRFIDRYMASVVESWRTRDWVVEEVDYIPSLVPISGSFLVKYRTSDGGTQRLYWTSYICKIGRFYIFQSYSRSPEPPAEFLDFLYSFSVLREIPDSEAADPAGPRRIYFPPFLLINLALLGAGMLAGWLFRNFGKTGVLSGPLAGIVLIVLSYGVELFLLFRVLGMVLDLPGHDQGKIFGRIAGDLLLPLAAAVFLLIRERQSDE